jgi:HEAT repeat protein
MRQEFAKQVEMLADRRSRVPYMVLVTPLDQHQLRSGLIKQKWVLKLCCMYPGGEHTLEGGDNIKEGETRPELGRYLLEDFGAHTVGFLRWAKNYEKVLKVVSPRMAAALEWVHQDAVTKFLGEHAKSVSDLSLPESGLTPGAAEHLPAPSEMITLAGLRESDYRVLEGQALVFLEEVFKRHQSCGSLHLFVDQDGRMLWLCGRHLEQMRATREAADAARREELLGAYLRHVEAQVSKVRIPGDPELHDLTEVFVDLTVLGDCERPSSRTQAEFRETVDAELHNLSNPLSASDRAGREQRAATGRKVGLEEVLKPGARSVIAGAPGGGKSTLLKYLALKALRSEDYLPVFLELNTLEAADFAAAKGSLAELLFTKCVAEVVCEKESDRAGLREEFYKKLKAGRVALFLDGLDEVSGTEFFDGLRLSVRAFLRRGEYRGNILIVSTRPYALLDRFGPEEAQEFEIAPLAPEQIEKFVGLYYGGDPRAAEFLDELRRRPDLRELASVPALLGFLLILRRAPGGGLPEDRLELYSEVVQKLVGAWDKEKPAKREFQTSDGRRIDFLAQLAFTRLFDAPGRPLSRRFIFTGREIFKEVEHYCWSRGIADKTEILAEEVKATALLRQVGADAYAFAHLTLQEYAAATALAEHDERAKIVCRAYFDPTLSEMEVLPMALGLAEQQHELHDALKALPESLDHKNLRLRARSLAYGHPPNRLLSALGDKLEELVRGESEIEGAYFEAVVRAYAAASGAIGEEIARRVASGLVEAEHEYVRGRAVRALGVLGNEAAFGALRLALNDNDASARVEAASLLGPKDKKAALDVLTQELRSGDDDVKEDAVYALWNLGGEGAVEALEEAAERRPAVRKEALEALADLRGEAAVPVLTQHLSDPEERVRNAVVESLGEIGGESVIPELIRAADDADIYVAKKAIRSLGQIGGERAVRYLTDSLEKRPGQLLGEVAEALGRAGAVEAIPKLAHLLDEYEDDADAEDFMAYLTGGWIEGCVRVKVAGALCRLGDGRGRDALVEILSKDYSENRKRAAGALGRCRPEEARALLPEVIGKISAAYDPDKHEPFTFYHARYDLVALAEVLYDLDACDDPRVVTAMLNILKGARGSHDSLTSVAMNVLGHVGGPAAVEALTKEVESTDPMRQLGAVVALGNIADENTVEGLLKGLTSGWGVVVPYAARGLARVEAAALYRGLKLSIRSTYPKVRLKDARCIFYYSHDEQAVELVSELAGGDRHEKIREAARRALDQLERQRALFD